MLQLRGRGFQLVFGVIIVMLSLFSYVEPRESSLSKVQQNRKTTTPARHPLYLFASRLLNEVASDGNTQGNILLSPYSIRTAMAIVYLGAKGKTAEEIRGTLDFPSEREDLIRNLGRQINLASSPSSSFNIGNGVFVDSSVEPDFELSKTLRRDLNATVEKLPLQRNPQSSTASINSWISKLTEGYISEVVSPGSLNSDTSLLVVNGFFYTGQWLKPFAVIKEKKPFKINRLTQIPVTMMSLESTFGYGYIQELKSTGISMPFKDDRFEFFIIKPDEGQSVESVRRLMLNYPLEQLTYVLSENKRSVTLTLPKFTLKANYDAARTMKKMGIKSLFDSKTSDLSGLIIPKGKKNVAVSRMVHQTILDVHEFGATGGAATLLEGYPISSSSAFDVDTPFLFMLNDRLTGPVMIGQLVNPNQNS